MVHNYLTYWGRATHVCISSLISIASDNGLLPGLRQSIISTNAAILSIEILVGIQIFSFTKMHLKISSATWRPFCLGLNVLSATIWKWIVIYRFSRCFLVLQGSGNLHAHKKSRMLAGIYLKKTTVKETHLTNEEGATGSRHIAMFLIG